MSKVIYLSHGGGPMPLTQPETHINLINYYKEFGNNYIPKAIIVFSAHLEKDDFTVISEHPEALLFDYYGFPKEAYNYKYNPPTDNVLKEKVIKNLLEKNIHVNEAKQGFDHGVFIPLMLMYPNQEIPVIQVSIKKGLDELEHIKLGRAFKELANEEILFIGSGSSFHNLREIMGQSGNDKNNEFHNGLVDILTKDITEEERTAQLIDWRKLPNATFCHPRSEHLIPLLICYGIKESKAEISFDNIIIGKRNICALW